MKKIEAVIRTSAFAAVQLALQRRGIEGMTVSEVVGFGHEPGSQATYRGVVYPVEGIPRLRLQIVAPDQQVSPIVDAIARAARAGRPGDGLISTSPVEDVVRIRTGERGVAAVTSDLPGDAERPSASTVRVAARRS